MNSPTSVALFAYMNSELIRKCKEPDGVKGVGDSATVLFACSMLFEATFIRFVHDVTILSSHENQKFETQKKVTEEKRQKMRTERHAETRAKKTTAIEKEQSAPERKKQ